MHLSIEQLLEIRDAGARPAEVAHLETCTACRAELERVRAVQAQLVALPQMRPNEDRWRAVREAAETLRWRRPLVRVGWAAAALAAMITLAVGIRGGIEAYQENKLARETRSLIADSQRLEKTLRAYESSGRVVNATTAGTIAQIEDRIGLLDNQIAQTQAKRLWSPEAIALWRERVRLLDALVNVQATRVAYVGL